MICASLARCHSSASLEIGDDRLRATPIERAREYERDRREALRFLTGRREARGHGLVISSVQHWRGIDPDALREAAVAKGRPPDD